jgi:hypothetical protein
MSYAHRKEGDRIRRLRRYHYRAAEEAAEVELSRSRLSEQNLRVDEWSVCRG